MITMIIIAMASNEKNVSKNYQKQIRENIKKLELND